MENNNINENQKINNVKLEREVRSAFIDYSMSVIVSRALPDVRDGLKPVHRRILFAMHDEKYTHDKPMQKSVKTVSAVMGGYHPHGDGAIYDSVVRMAQPFSLRYPLVEGEGNFGNIDGMSAAAMRYTKARMDRLGAFMLDEIEKETVDFVPNYDNSLQEPSVLPARFPNLLVNGSVGIAVGMATNIPPHNMTEVIDGTIHLMDNPECEVVDLMEFIKAPDFPTGATICGTSGVMSAYTTGRGSIMVRGRAEVDEDKREIIITEIPYQVNKANLVKSIADCYRDKKVEGITALRDESSLEGIRIVIEYRRDANGEVILNQLYKFTQLQDTFAANMLAIVNGVPRTLNLKQMLEHYITHQRDVTIRGAKFDLAKARAEHHIYEGYKKALDLIEDIIRTIRASDSPAHAREQLVEVFDFTEIQAQAIVDMTLGRLSGMERQRIEDRLAKLTALVAELEEFLASPELIDQKIKDGLLEIKAKFGDDRRTELVAWADDILLEDLIPKHTCVITMSHAGYIKRMNSDTYTAQRRGGRGIVGMTTKEEDFVEHVITADSHSHLLMFTNFGKVQVIRPFMLPEAGRTAKGSNIVNILSLEEGEKVTAFVTVDSFAPPTAESVGAGSARPPAETGDTTETNPTDSFLLFITRKGIVKRTKLSEYAYQRKGGKRALTLDEDDELVYVRHTSGSDEVVIATRGGNAVRFAETAARPLSRTARGVRGMKLKEGDVVAGVALVDESKKLLTITENGFGKQSTFEGFTTRNRGTQGVICHNINEKTGPLVGIATVDEGQDVMLVTDGGVVIRTPVKDISTFSRTASGVIIMRTGEDVRVINMALVEREEVEEDSVEGEE
ncbi:MAG: DNA gyrase subunit A [Oscillospiraceae bacterium]|nr:DNA gyrase subunit A [Oscillospiraceae bacterium]